jgi:hypothetical protein
MLKISDKILKCHTGGQISAKKCDVLFEWPLSTFDNSKRKNSVTPKDNPTKLLSCE